MNMCSNSSGRSETLVELAQRLRHYTLNHTFENSDELVGEKRAAVLICLFEGEKGGEIRVILTKRSSTMSSHSGEVALPGGKREEGDKNNAETALREAKEEIGLDPSIVEVLATLEPFHTKKQFIIVVNGAEIPEEAVHIVVVNGTKILGNNAVIGVIWDKNAYKPVPNADEVESIFDAPLEMFLKDENRREEEREWMGCKYLLHFFYHQAGDTAYVIWALTAGILIKAASIVYQRPPIFEERRPKFWSRSGQ